MQNFQALGAPPPDSQNSKTAPPLRISGYAPESWEYHIWHEGWCSSTFFGKLALTR